MIRKASSSGGKKKTATRVPRQRSRRASSRAGGFSLTRLMVMGALLLLLVVSLAVVGYTIFFRVALADERPDGHPPVLFEEPELPVQHPFGPAENMAPRFPVKVAIIIDDMGYHPEIGRELLRLQRNFSFSFLPHAPHTADLEEEAYQLGRTILLHLPLEAKDASYDPGPGTLLLRHSREERRTLLEDDLRQVPHAVGVNNHMGSRFTVDEAAMDELVEELAKRELFFVDSVTISGSKGASAARRRGVPAAQRDVFLDNVQEETAICSRLKQLVALARWQGEAIGIGHPHRETLNALAGCGAPLLDQVSVVGVDELVKSDLP